MHVMQKMVTKPLNKNIRFSRPEDAEKITEAFKNEYEDYYGMYVNTSELEEFLYEMNQKLEESDRPEEIRNNWYMESGPEIVETVENNGEFVGVGAIKLKDNLAELGSTIICEDDRGLKTIEGDSVYDELFQERLDLARQMVENPDNPTEIVYTQLLADKSAATQHVADKHDFAVTGVYDKKFPLAYEDKGRVTVVDMLWSDSNIENNQEKVYVPETAEEIVRTAQNNINEKRNRSLEEITRTVSTDYSSHEDRNYKVKPKIVGAPMNFAELQVIEDSEGNYAWSDMLSEISKAQEQIDNEEDDYWVGLTLDANSLYLPTAAEELEEFGFEYAGFNPGKIDSGNEDLDALEMQYRPSTETYEKQFVNEAAEFIRDTGMNHRETSNSTGHESSEVLEI